MKNLILILFTIFLSYKIGAGETSDQAKDDLLRNERMIYESELVISSSRELRHAVSNEKVEDDEGSSRNLASVDPEEVKWMNYWDELMNKETEDPTFWLNKTR